MKRAIVTGASGMIGATLIRQLIDLGVEVLAIVRPQSEKSANIPESPLVKRIACDLSQLRANFGLRAAYARRFSRTVTEI